MVKRTAANFLCALIFFAPACGIAAEELRNDITHFGARADGTTLNTAAIQRAVDETAAAGGGMVVVPKGVFLSGAIFLKPGVNLRVEKDGVLKGSTDIEQYPRTMTRIEGHSEQWRPALVNASKADGLQITGEGTLDGSGAPFWEEFWRRRGLDRATKNLDVDRPRLLFIADSRNVTVSGLSLKDSGFWNLHLYRCRDVVIDGLRITAPNRAPSTDGIDVDSCQDVTIQNCFISTDDDSIALKGSKGPFALEDKDSPPVERIRVRNCTFGWGAGILTLGSEATVVRDVLVEDCRVVNTGGVKQNNIVRFKLRPDTPQHYENIHFRNITTEGANRFIYISVWRQYFDLKGQPPPSSTVRNITVKNVHGTFATVGELRGHDQATIENLHFEDVDIQVDRPNLDLGPVKNLEFKNFKVNGAPFVPQETPARPPRPPLAPPPAPVDNL